MILSYHVNRRGTFDWPSTPDPMYHIVSIPQQKKIISLYWPGDPKPRKRDGWKHIWVKRTEKGALRVAPGVQVEWAPLMEK